MSDNLTSVEYSQSLQRKEIHGSPGESSSSEKVDEPSYVNDVNNVGDQGLSSEQEPLIQTVECRICQEEDTVSNLETPCGCSGSLKFAHRKCVQRWCNEKGDISCEICHQPYQHGYTAPPPAAAEEITIDIGDGWTIAGNPIDLRDPRILAMAATDRHLLEPQYDEYADSNANGAAFCRSAALILMALLLLRHTMSLNNGDGDDDDASTFLSLFLLRVASFLLPCYIMAWAISIIQHRRRRQKANMTFHNTRSWIWLSLLSTESGSRSACSKGGSIYVTGWATTGPPLHNGAWTCRSYDSSPSHSS